MFSLASSVNITARDTLSPILTIVTGESCLCDPSSLHVVPSGSWSADQMEDERFGCVKILRRVSTWSRASAGGGKRSTA